MNRVARREQLREIKKENKNSNKKIRKQLTDEQFKEMKEQVFYEAVDMLAAEKIGLFITHFSDCIYKVMRENRISEERVDKILKETIAESEKKLNLKLRG